MQQQEKHKLYDLEIIPPPSAWDQITAALDSSDISHPYRQKLLQAEVLPPAGLWQKIGGELDDTPVAHEYASKLQQLEVVPPAHVWTNIAGQLDQDGHTNTKSGGTIPWLKYAAAAAVLAFMTWGALQLFSPNRNGANENVNAPIAKQKTQEDNSTREDSIPSLGDENTIAHTDAKEEPEAARENAALEASKKTYANLSLPATTRSKIRNASDFFFVSDNYDYVSDGGGTRSPGIVDQDLTVATEPKTYFTIMTPEGNYVRMSSKLKDMICCVSGEDEGQDCVDQMKKWRDKLANPARGHSPGNFLDIMSMIKALQE